VAPVLIGGRSAPSPVGGNGAAAMAQATRLDSVRIEQIGEDMLVVGYPRARQSNSSGGH
jgi:diaminohydroxyphosphoribosylaminopyrimidine deaminase/5-amino-6-(5-phosphoribosylamino)uracil reductase